jgi:hypothetical protein
MLLAGAAAGAAVAINVGYVVQHSGLASAPRIELRRPLAAVAALLRCPRWVAGAVLGYAGLALEYIALTALPLSAVQATIGAGLVIVAVLSRVRGGVALARGDVLGAALAIAALAVIAVATPAAGAAHHAPSPLGLAAAAAVVAGGGGLAALRLRTAAGLALAAGLLYGMTSIAMAALAPLLAGASPPLAVAGIALATGVPATAAGFVCFQRALQRGRPLPVVTAMMAGMDVVAIAGGLLVLGDPLASGAGARTAQLAGLALAALSAVVVLHAGRREAPAAEKAPGLERGEDTVLRSRVRRIGARPGVPAADDLQVRDGGPSATRAPVEA